VVLLACAWPLCLHFAILFAGPEWPARVNAGVAALGLALWAIAERRAAAAACAVALALALGLALMYAPQLLLLAPPVVINALLAACFGMTLRPGHEPLIAAFARLEQGGLLPPDLAHHVRVVTWLWTLLLAGIAAVALALALWAPLEAWSLFTNAISYALIGALLVGEYAYRRVRFRHYRHASLIELIRNARSANLFARR
jgi:uncharacterized membrane protein